MTGNWNGDDPCEYGWDGVVCLDDSVISLEFGERQLEGTLPDSIGDLLNLQLLRVSHNNFTGTIPNTLYQIPALKFMWLQDNQLTGTLPPSIYEIENLMEL
eukprot:gene6075-7297_t